MIEVPRRAFFGAVGTAGIVGSSVVGGGTSPEGRTDGSRVGADGPSVGDWSLDPVGHSTLSDPPGLLAEGVVRPDGRYAAVTCKQSAAGSLLVALEDPANPSVLHRLPSGRGTLSRDVKFDPRDGLYYRTHEGGEGGVEVIDYGYGAGTPREPAIVGAMDAGDTHNVSPHPDERIVYAVDDVRGDTPGVEVWDVSDPSAPSLVGRSGPNGGLHDVTVDPERDLLHAAYIYGETEGYVVLDVSAPREPSEIGRFDYASRPSYSDVGPGAEAFQNCHYADFDPTRGLAIVGDEIGRGVPGGKHVFDIGWDQGSPADPVPVGFTKSPSARTIEEDDDRFAWTGHNFDVVTRTDATLLASGDYKEGVVLYDLTDPTNPHPVDRHPTDRSADAVDGPDHLAPPRAWGASVADEADLIVGTDMFTGLYAFRIGDGGD